MICLLTDNIKYNFWPLLLILATLLFSETKLYYFSLFKHRYIIYSNLYLVIYKFSAHFAILYIMELTQQFYSRINVQKNYLITNISKNDLRQKIPCKCWLPFLRQRSKILLVVESRNRNMYEFQIIHLLFIITPKRYTNVWENLEAVKILNNHLAIFKVGWVVK